MIRSRLFFNRFKSGVVWASVGTLSLQGGTFLTNLVIANFLGAELFGQFGLTISTSQMLAGVLQLSAGIAATKYLAQYRNVDKEQASKALGLCIRVSACAGAIGTLFLILFASHIAEHVLEAGFLKNNLLIAAPIVLFSVLSGFQVGAFAGLEGFFSAAKALIALMVIQVSTIAFAGWQFGLVGATIAMSLNFGLRSIVCHKLLLSEARRQDIYNIPPGREFTREAMFKFMLPGALTGLTATPALWIVSVALSKVPGGFEQVALFNAAIAVRAILMIFPWILNSLGLSLLSNHLSEKDKGMFDKILLLLLALTFAIVSVGSLIVYWGSEYILSVYGEEFAKGSVVLDILLISLLAEALALPLCQALASHGKMWKSFFIIVLPRDLLIVFLGLYWVNEYLATGLAYAHSVAWIYALVVAMALVWRGRKFFLTSKVQ